MTTIVANNQGEENMQEEMVRIKGFLIASDARKEEIDYEDNNMRL